MLAARNRLRASGDFSLTVRRGRRVGRRTLVIHALAGDGQDAGQDSPPVLVGFVVSKAVGNAVTRNRTRRRLRALMAQRTVGLPAGARVVVRALPAAATASSSELDQDLSSALAKVWRKP